MSTRGADWYKREPRAFLEGIRQLTEREVAVYAVVLDLIYDGGHQTLDDPKHIASYFSDLGAAGVRRAIDRLIDAGKLIRSGEFLTNKRAQNEGKTREELTETRRNSGRLGGVSSGKSRTKPMSDNGLGEAFAPYAGAIDKKREDIEKKEEANASSKELVDEPDFEDFYQAYPRHVGKGAARAAYAKARRKVSADILLIGAGKYATESAGKDLKFVAHPATWLNAERWDDDAAANAASANGDEWARREAEIYSGLR